MTHECFWENAPKPVKIVLIALGGVLVAAVVALFFGFVVLWLWNWLMPAIFGLPTITFWQAWGLVLLSHIFFKSITHPNHSHHEHFGYQARHEEFFQKIKRKFGPGPEAN